MGLFNKKVFTDGFVLEFFDGDLNGFSTNTPCNILLKDGKLHIRRAKPEATASLDINKIIDIEVIGEIDYMSKYRGQSHNLGKQKIQLTYFLIKYKDKDGNPARLDFRGTALEIPKIRRIIDALPINEGLKIEL